MSFVIPGLKAFNSTRRVPLFKDYIAVLRAVLLKLAQAVLEARISGGSREKIEEKIAPVTEIPAEKKPWNVLKCIGSVHLVHMGVFDRGMGLL